MNPDKPGIVPRHSFSLFIMEIPYLGGKELKSAVRNQLVGLFPGSLEGHAVEIKKNRGKKWSYLVFVLAAAKAESPLLISTLFVREYFRKKTARAVFVGDTWVEFIFIEKGSIVKSAVKTRGENSLPGSIYEFPWTDNDPADADIDIFCRQCDAPLFQNNTAMSPRICILEKELPKIGAGRFSLFSHLGGGYKRKRILLCVLGISSLAALAVFLFDYRSAAVLEKQRLLLEQENLKRITERQGKEYEYIERLKTKYRELAEGRRVAPYEIIEIVSRCLDRETKIITETVRENFFQFEATAPDALAVLKTFEENDQIRSPVMRQIYPEGRSDRFIISASVIPKIEAVPENITADEQRAVLEKLIARLEEGGYGRAAYTPSLFGVSIRSLLSKWGCAITGYQYITADNSREVEFSIHAESGKFFGFLRDSVSLDNGWYFKLIQIRNLSPLNMLDIVFRVTGNIEAEENASYVSLESPEADIPVDVTEIIKNYYTRPAVTAAPPPPEPEPEPVEPPARPERASWMEFVGIVGDNSGTQFVYIKDKRNNQVMKLSPEAENDPGYVDLQNGFYEVRIEGKSYELGRNR